MRLNRQGFKIGKCKRKAILAEFGIFKDIQAYSGTFSPAKICLGEDVNIFSSPKTSSRLL